MNVALPMQELLRRRVRALVRLIEKSKRAIIATDLQEELGELSEAALRGLNVGTKSAEVHPSRAKKLAD